MIVSGKEYEWQNIEFTINGVPINGVPINGITKVEYADGTKKITDGLSYKDIEPLYNTHKRLPRKNKKWLTNQLWSTFMYRPINKRFMASIFNGEFKFD